ncbi:hypothetical protein THAOC_00948 [Thalassiosira oceanica]|uniref:Uncharacterized protein n=1 Tax=Thalassiosira oceanica TaxID=159749 RepID=K0TEV8_THAOC|nr:hypothetical protein THAOC_00948 [Thalassiosira oceanica]|eukprot:EJK77233.1 hypothetical protein THAOC_00948 [Thalassiosira oceanica]
MASFATKTKDALVKAVKGPEELQKAQPSDESKGGNNHGTSDGDLSPSSSPECHLRDMLRRFQADASSRRWINPDPRV